MQQLSSLPLLNSTSQPPGHAKGSWSVLGETSSPGSEIKSQAPGFSFVFQTVNDGESLDSETGTLMTWDQFSEQFPELVEQLGGDFDFEAFFSQFQIEGQNVASIPNGVGELLPLDLSAESIPQPLSDMTAWFKEMGVELTVDGSGQIVPVSISGSESLELNGSDAQTLEKITAAISDLFTSITQQLKDTQDQSQSSLAESESEHVVLSSVMSLDKGLEKAANQSALNTAAPNANVSAPVSPILGSTNLENGQATTALTTKGAGEGLAPQGQGMMDSGTQSGFNQQGQTESNASFKAGMEALRMNATGDEVVDELVGVKPSDSASSKFAEVQSKIQGGLKQYSTGLGTPVSDPSWPDQMSQKIVWMTGRNIQSAEIHLNPAELGPVEVKISVQNEQAAITFNAQHASVRELLESNVHRLREMMDSNGVDLGEVDVGDGGQEAAYANQDGDGGKGSGSVSDDLGSEGLSDGEETTVSETPAGLVDYYA